ncbi:T9SS type A sorting domain-containing protein [candidate division KSB1 bacterium]|nr:T9SS type A sorting domain-containing protein [candidate division KSB1 bacterium]
MKYFIIFSIVLFIPFILFAQNHRINVPGDFTKIQDAINSSVDGDTILVAPGTYYENVNFKGKNILLSSHYFFNEDVSFINTTIIDGSKPQFSDTTSVALFLSGEKNTAILQGFTITGGKGSRVRDQDINQIVRSGGGILIDHASPTIRHNIIAYNNTTNSSGFAGGGGIAAHHSNAIISNNIIYKNNAEDGGGVILGHSGVLFRNNVIAFNTTNPTHFGGGGVFVHGVQGKFINNTVVYNSSDKGGGIATHDGDFPIVNIENSIIYGNTTGSSNAQITGPGTFNITNTNIEGGWSGNGNVDENPLFIENTPLILQEGSPCVDRGDPNIVNNDWEDADNPGFALSPALGTLRNDMGAYGGNQYKSMPYSNVLITGVEDENKTTPNNIKLNQNYPNPFNPTTTITYELPFTTNVVLTIYDVLGHEVRTLVNTHQLSGRQSVTWDGRNGHGTKVSSGVFIYRLQTENRIQTRKMILMK